LDVRSISALVVFASLFVALPAVGSAAESYPQRPIRLIVPVPPGGASDFTARIVGAKLTDMLAQNVVVENRGGAAGTIACDLVAQSTPDGYTLVFSSSTTHGIAPNVYRKLPYDPMKSFTHVALINTIPAVMVVHQSVPAKTVKEFVALAKAKPNGFLFGSSGAGSPPHLLGELFKMVTGAPITHVPYKGSGPAVIDLAGGQLHAMLDGLPSLIGQIKGGKLRPLAAASAKRSNVLPDLPTMAEAGFPGVEGGLWFGISAAAGTPSIAAERLSKAIFTITAQEDVKERFASVGGFATPLGPKDYTEFIRKDIAKWAPVVKAAGVAVD
jgi:tripartite-type tricarboxylate transporter receptor subunit TctC